MPRPSDLILAADLREAGLDDLAERAENGEWNDYFGIHDAPQHHLVQTLRGVVKLANVTRKELVRNTMDGKYDGTLEESREWTASEEGQQAFGDLTTDK